MNDFIRIANYHETDQMGVIHHSNYIKWMEEARIHAMDASGYPYGKFEEMGMICPVLSIACNYKKSVRFGDEVRVVVFLAEQNKVKFTLGYEMYNISAGDVLSATGVSSHCFMTREGRILNMEKEMAGFVAQLKTLVK